MTTAVTPYMIKDFKRASSVAFEVITDSYSNESLKATGNGTVTIEFATEVSSCTTVKTHGIEFIVDLQILIDNAPLKDIDQTSMRVAFSGLDLKFLAKSGLSKSYRLRRVTVQQHYATCDIIDL